MSVNHEYGTAFWHIPKTAGSSMGQLPFVTIGNRFPDGRLFPIAEKVLKSSPEWWPSYFKFAFVRHPLDRFVSAYHYFDQMGPVRIKALRPKRKRAVLAVKACRTFNQFCGIFSRSNEICRDIHFKPQHSWICDQDGNILAKNLRGAALENKLEEIFGS